MKKKSTIISTILVLSIISLLLFQLVTVSLKTFNLFNNNFTLETKLVLLIGIIALLVILFYYKKYISQIILYLKTIPYFKLKIFVVLFSLGIGIISIILSDITLKKDPKLYFEVAKKFVDGNLEFSMHNTWHRRTLFYTLPLLKVFPHKLIYIKIFNLFLLILTAVCYSYLLEKNINKKVGLIFFSLYLLYPVHYFIINIVSHDLVANFYLALFFVNIFLISKIKKIFSVKSIFLVFSCAILILINDIQRSTFLIIISSLIFALILFFINNEKRNYSLLSLYSVVIVTFFITKSIVFTHYEPEKNNKFLSSYSVFLYAFNELETNGSFESGKEVYFDYSPTIEKEILSELASNKIIDQLLNFPVLSLQVILKKATNLLHNNPYSYTYMFNNFSNNKNGRILLFSLLAVNVYWLVIYIVAIFGCIVLRYSQKFVLLLLISFPILFIFLMVFTQVNAYYSYSLVPLLIVFAAIGINTKNKIEFFRISRIHFLKYVISIIIIFFFLLLVYFTLFLHNKNSKYHFLRLSEIELSEDVNSEMLIEEINPYSIKIHQVTDSITANIVSPNISDYTSLCFLLKIPEENTPFKVKLNGKEVVIKNCKKGYSVKNMNYCFFRTQNIESVDTLKLKIFSQGSIENLTLREIFLIK